MNIREVSDACASFHSRDDLEYIYPVLAIREMQLWKPEEMTGPPSFHFGIGVGTIIR